MAHYLTGVLLNAARDRDPGTVEGWIERITEANHQLTDPPEDPAGEHLWLLAADIAIHRRRLQTLEAAIAQMQITDIKANGPVRFGDSFLKAGKKTKKTLPNVDGAVAYISATAANLDVDGAMLLARVFRPEAKTLRITTLKQIARRAYDASLITPKSDEGKEKYVQAVVDTFLDVTVEDEAKLDSIPIDKAPQYAQKLDHGQRVGSFGNK